jgi:hypothetical protein
LFRSANAPILLSLRASSDAATAAVETKPSLLGTIRERLGRRNATAGLDVVSEEISVQVQPSARLNNTNVDPQTEPPKVAVPSTGGNGSNGESEPAAETSNATPNLPEDNPVRLLLDQVTTLEPRAASLAGRLAEAVRELQSGSIPAESVASDLTLFQTDVQTLQRQAVELARSLSVPADGAIASVETFRGLHTMLAAICETEERNVFRNLHVQAARELESVLAIEPCDGIEFTPLDESKSAAERLLAEVGGAEWPNSHPECLPLVERRHPCSRLLDLVRDAERLSDNDWETAQEAVATAFGRRLAVAAVRGRLRVKSGPADPVQAVSHCPACKADLEPGAKFCGECGVRID